MGRLVNALVWRILRDDAMMSAVGLSLTIAACAQRQRRSSGRLRRWCWCVLAVSRIKWFCLYDHRAAGDARCITGLSLLLLFVALAHAIGWPRTAVCSPSGWRMSLSVRLMCSRYFVASAGTGSLDRRSRDDLGATPLKVFFVITLPMIMPRSFLAGYWLLLCRLMIW